MDYEIFLLEVPVKEHQKPKIIEAKNTEIENLKTYETFEEVLDEGQETIGSRWIITEKQKHDGQKKDYKARLVAKGFQEIDQPQSDSPKLSSFFHDFCCKWEKVNLILKII